MSKKTTKFQLSYAKKLKIGTQYLMPAHLLSKSLGYLAEKRLGIVTQLMIKAFSAKYNINLDEAHYSSLKDYNTFNEFFTRRLKDSARPIAKNSQCIAPADGILSEFGLIEAGRLIQAKGHYFSLVELLGGEEQHATPFLDGSFATIYLSPRDYHRVHMPCDATLVRMVYIPGELYSVNPFLAQHIPGLFAKNERVVCYFDTAFGPMVQILVGATITASIETSWAGVVNYKHKKDIVTTEYALDNDLAIKFKQGDYMGLFKLGSTVINLFGFDVNFGDKSAGEFLHMGERLTKLTEHY